MSKKTFRKAAISTMAASTVVAAVAPAATFAADNGFSDFSSKEGSYEAVMSLVNQGIIKGFPDGTFRPWTNLNRSQAAALLTRAKGLEAPADLESALKGYSDVSVNHENAKEIAAVTAAGYFGGNSGKFMSYNDITREQMAKVLVKAFELDKLTLPHVNVNLDNVDPSFKEYVQILANAGVTTELSNFKPTGKVNRAQFATFLYRAMNVNVAPQVVGVSALNAKELAIKFNKPVKEATVIDSADSTLADTTFVFNDAPGDSLKAELSKDGKTLIVTSASTWEGSTKVEVLTNKVETLNGEKLGYFLESISYTDTVRPEILGVTYIDSVTAEITLSEPVASVGTATAKYEDSTLPGITVGAPAADTTHQVNVTHTPNTNVVTVDLSDAQLAADKNIVISLPEIKDLATVPNIATPKTATVVKSTADKVAPKINSVVATGFDGTNTTFDIKLNEKAHSTSPLVGLKINGNPVTATVDSVDPTVIHATVAAKVTGSALLYVPQNQILDLSLNGNDEVGSFYTLNLETVKPAVSAYTVERVNGVEHLVVTLTEKVTLDTSKKLTFTWVDSYGMTQTFTTVDATGVSLVNPDANSMSNKLQVNLKTAFTDASAGTLNLAGNTNYKLTFDAGLVEDGYNNLSDQFANISFNTTTLDTGNGQLVATASSTQPGVVTVNFTGPVNATDAVNLNNYAVEGATIKEAKLISNSASGAVVELTLNSGTVEATGYYNVTVKPVKPFNGNDTANESTVTAVQLTENVSPVVLSKVLTDYQAETFTVAVTFNDATVVDGAGLDFELYVDGVATGEKITSASVASGVVTLTYTDAGTAVKDLTTASSVKLVVLQDTIDIKDGSGNIVNVSEIVIR